MLIESPTLTSSGGFFVMKKANECTRIASARTAPKMLFGEFWRESELAILFADPGAGKSVLAMQIAESIADGHEIAPFQMTAQPQKVLYFDLDLTEQQFGMRYAREIDDGEDTSHTDNYAFSDNFIRLELNADTAAGALTAQSFASSIESLVKETGAKVLVIDNITLLKRTSHSGRCEVLLVHELNRLKRKYGLSILVLAASSRRDGARPLAPADLRASRIICNFADSVFAIGASRQDASLRYIKHLRSKNYEVLYDTTYVPVFTIRRLADNFLGAEFVSFGDERDQLLDPKLDPDANLRDAVKDLRDQGLSYRDIGDQLNISKTRAHRLRMQWHPRPEKEAVRKEVNPYYFPGCEEYDEAFDDPKFEHLYEPDHPEALTLGRDYILLEKARYAAREEFKQTGNAPSLAEALAVQVELDTALSTGTPIDDIPEPVPKIVKSYDPMAGLKRDVDPYGKKIFVKTYTTPGKPQLWYQYDPRGQIKQWERKGDGIIGTTIVEMQENEDGMEKLE
jgi:KaiC/GvpD/RAD55 family RecA-like ATPase